MKFGHFDDQNKEYVITNPQTPFPWINYLGTEDFFSLISNTGGGYSFYKDARLRRITRYKYNDVPVDNVGKYFYINDNGDVWSPGWKPVKAELDSYECRHGLGYTRIVGSKNAIQADITFFVPQGFEGEVQRVKVANLGDSTKTIKLFSYVEFCLWNAMDDMTNFQRNLNIGEVEIDGSTLYHKTEYRERRNHYAFYTVNCPVNGFDTQREVFVGLYNGLDMPQVVKAGKASNSEAHGWSPIGSHQLNIELDPGEDKEFIFILGYVENPVDLKYESKGVINKKIANEMIAQYQTSEQVEKSLAELNDYWIDLLSKYQLQSHDERLDRMVNIWNQYQCMVTFNMSRSASFFESGIGRGMGFRDSNQDLLGFVHQIPERARERIIDIASTQFEDGGAYHQYQPLTKKGNHEMGGDFSDDPLWLIAATVAYIKETGDMKFLDEIVPFDNNEDLAQPMFEHLKRSFYKVANNLGQHQLPLIGRADWNDCLNLNCFSTEPDESFQVTENQEGGVAESVFVAGLFILYGNEYLELCEVLGKTDEAEEAKKHIEKMRTALLSDGWDGEWFVRAYDHYSRKVGSKENEEGQIFIEPQGICVMAGAGVEDGKARQALDSVKKLLDCDYGVVLNYPPFTEYQVHLGEITSYPPGYKENAGIFCHNNPWIMVAETVLGNGDAAFDYYQKIAPAFLEEISDLHRTEPYVYSQMIAGRDAFKPGEAKNSWLTGTAAWNFVAIANAILGIKPQYNGLMVDPCIPKNWDGFKVQRKFRDVTYNIKIQNPDHVSKGIKEMIIEGQSIEGNIIPVIDSERPVGVEVVMG